MSAAIADDLLVELVAEFRRTICTGPKETIRRDLYVREGRRRTLPKWGGFAAGAAAFLALTKDANNPWYGRDDLLQLAFDAGERLLTDHLTVGRSQPKPNHFTIYPLASLYALAGDHADKSRRNRWRELLARNLKQVQATVDRCWKTLGKPGPYAGTGPNHLFGWIAVGYGQALALGDTAALPRLEQAMRRHLTIQAPGGYFPEHDGPVVLYQTVSLQGIAEFHHHKPLPETSRALQQGIDFLLRALYPDFTGIATFDERNRRGGPNGLLSALVWTAAGRRFLQVNLERMRMARTAQQALRQPDTDVDRTRQGVQWWPLGHLFRTLEQAREAARRGPTPVRPMPLDSPRASWRIETRGFVRREGPWLHALSAWCNQALPGNPYHLERNEAFSLYHDQTGLLIGGGNDKMAPHNATIHVVEEGEVHYYPPVRAELQIAKPPRLLRGVQSCDRLRQDYGCAQVELEAAPVNAQTFRLAATAVSNMVNHEIALVLQLSLAAPLTLKTGAAAKRLHTLNLKKQTAVRPLETIPLGDVLELPGQWRMHLSPGAALQWPHRPWNPYRPPEYRMLATEAVALVRIPIRLRTALATVTVTVLGEVSSTATPRGKRRAPPGPAKSGRSRTE